ncbi:hypothetical protein GCM10018773_65750 [Streptomyces candidus]|nr:hypothetical protein GCM10018773_65750 [Streptomyces candidus]
MRLTLTDGHRKVKIVLAGASAEILEAAEQSALRLLAAVPPSTTEPEPAQEAFGFSLSADTERAVPDESTELEQEEGENHGRTWAQAEAGPAGRPRGQPGQAAGPRGRQAPAD